MVIQTGVWGPQTCSCVIQVMWNDATAVPQYSLVQYIVKDGAHANLDDATAIKAIADENTAFNVATSTATTTFPALAGSGVTINWNFIGQAPNRVLNLSFNGAALTNAHLIQLQNTINTAIASGRVHIPTNVVVSGITPLSGIAVMSGLTVQSGIVISGVIII